MKDKCNICGILGGHFVCSQAPVIAECEKWKSLAVGLYEFTSHSEECILTYWECGEPMPDGGYRTKYKGVWYQQKPVDETPKCDCGFAEFEAKARAEGL